MGSRAGVICIYVSSTYIYIIYDQERPGHTTYRYWWIDVSIDWLSDLLIDWLIGWMIDGFIDRLVDWWVDASMDLLMD